LKIYTIWLNLKKYLMLEVLKNRKIRKVFVIKKEKELKKFLTENGGYGNVNKLIKTNQRSQKDE